MLASITSDLLPICNNLHVFAHIMCHTQGILKGRGTGRGTGRGPRWTGSFEGSKARVGTNRPSEGIGYESVREAFH